MSSLMSTFAEISCYAFMLCLILGVMEYFSRVIDKKGWGKHCLTSSC